MSRWAVTWVAVCVAISLAGCFDEDVDPSAAAASARAVSCPPDVEVLVVPPHSCAWIEVPQSESRHQIFVVVVDPPEPSDLPPILETGTDLGMAPDYAGLAPIAQRTGRRTVIVDLPGTGHSIPSLDCPESDALGEVAHDDPDLLATLTACRDHLTEQGVDPSRMTPEGSGAALVSVMEALGGGRWVLMGHGTTGMAAVAVARTRPDLVEAMVLDSVVASADGWPARREALIRRVAGECASDRDCTRRHGDVRALWLRARQQANAAPVRLGGFRLDRAMLDRAVRWQVAPVSAGAGGLPALLAEAASGTPGPVLRSFARELRSAPPLCVGLLPKCATRDQVALGAVLSSLCPRLAEEKSFSSACRAWGVAVSGDDVGAVDGVPTLALLGAHNPYARVAEARAALQRWVPSAHVVVDARSGHNVLGTVCAREVRTQWLESPDRPPAHNLCLREGLVFP